MLLKYESSSPYIHNKPNSTITANFVTSTLPEPAGPFDILINPFASNSMNYQYSANGNFGTGSAHPVFSFYEGEHVLICAYDGSKLIASYEFMMPAHGLVFGFDDRVPEFIYVESM